MQACCNLNDSSGINLCWFPDVIGFAVGKLQVLKACLANVFSALCSVGALGTTVF